MNYRNRLTSPAILPLAIASTCLAILALSFTLACATKNVQVHPGAVSSFDSQAYDGLLVAQEVINQARASLQAGTLPVSAKPVINRAILAYNSARASWLIYRSAAQTNIDPQLAAADLQKAMADLTAAVAEIPKLQGRTP